MQGFEPKGSFWFVSALRLLTHCGHLLCFAPPGHFYTAAFSAHTVSIKKQEHHSAPVFNQDYRRTTYLIIFINIWMHKYPVNEHTTSIILSDTAPKKLIAFRSSVAKKIIQNIIIPQLISITMHANTCIILSTT